MNYWVEFKNRMPACVSAKGESEAKTLAEELGGNPVTQIRRLPYPAEPQLNQDPSGCPPFCHSPRKCAGRTSCPMSYACSE